MLERGYVCFYRLWVSRNAAIFLRDLMIRNAPIMHRMSGRIPCESLRDD